MTKTTGIAATALVLSACATTLAPQVATPPSVGLANPASVFCVQQGGKLRMVTTAKGVHGICVLPDGREIEEWTYFRSHQPAPK